MIRQALFALGLSAGAAHAQGLVPTAPILEACGGTRLALDVGLDAGTGKDTVHPDELARAEDVISARLGGLYSGVFDFTHVEAAQIIVSIPSAFAVDLDAIAPMFERVAFGFYDVHAMTSAGDPLELGEGQRVLPSKSDPDVSYVVSGDAIVDGSDLRDADASFDSMNRPAVSFRLSEQGGQTFGRYTDDNIGEPFAIVVRDEVLSAPTIMTSIYGGSGLITGAFSTQEANALAISLRSGLLPFDLDIAFSETMDGSDPSAAFCP